MSLRHFTVLHVIALFVIVLSLNHRTSSKVSARNEAETTNLQDEFVKLVLAETRADGRTAGEHARQSRVLRQAASSIFGNFDLAVVREEVRQSLYGHLTCTACKLGVRFFKLALSAKTSQNGLHNTLLRICVRFKLQPEKVCEGLLDIFMDEAYFILSNSSLTSAEICAAAVGTGCGSLTRRQHWMVRLPPKTKPPVVESMRPLPNFRPLHILHISDTHVDWLYEEGSPADCADPLCCRRDSVAAETARQAGKWGDFGKCGIPEKTFDDMFQFITWNHKIDYVFWTGDVPPHDVWRQNREEQLTSIQDSVAVVRTFFPRTMVLPAVGNHESVPPNSFPPLAPGIPLRFSVSWLYQALLQQWRFWLPRSTHSTIQRGGYYSVQIKPGLRVISLNTNFCYFANWWLLLNLADPVGQLRWLAETLQDAEDQNHKVYIIGHVPPGSPDCCKVWSENFYNIINRYEGTVVAQFYGHSHKDEFEVFYDQQNKKRATSVAYIGPSVTTYNGLNPAYRVYTVARDPTHTILDHETYMMDLDEANAVGRPLWKKLYSAKEAYKLPSLRPQEWSNLVDRMTSNKTLFDQFYRHYHRDSRHFRACPPSCRKDILCSLKSGKSQDPTLCIS